jgi:hypothetical protein
MKLFSSPPKPYSKTTVILIGKALHENLTWTSTLSGSPVPQHPFLLLRPPSTN